MGLFQSPQNVETNKMRSWEVQLQDGTKVTVNHRLDCIGRGATHSRRRFATRSGHWLDLVH